MKKNLFCICCLVASESLALASNVENPLYLPTPGEFYSKTGAAIMYKRADSTEAQIKKHHDGAVEFPIWRFTEDLGVGLNDRLALTGRFGWTQDNPIGRKGLHRGRIGLTYRILSEQSPIILDVYADAYLSGLMAMQGSYSSDGFTYDNYSTGRWGVFAGTRFGKTWNRFTLAGYVEYLQTFGSHNNKIKIDQNMIVKEGTPYTMAIAGIPSEISVDLASNHEVNFGINGFYDLSEKWSIGGGFEFVQHSDNSVKSIHTELNTPVSQTLQDSVVNGLLAQTADMNDGWDEYIIKAVAAYQMTENVQLAAFAEYTFDNSHSQSQNGTDIKAELGMRVNVQF